MLLQLLCKFYDFKCGAFLHSTEVPAGPVGVFGNSKAITSYFVFFKQIVNLCLTFWAQDHLVSLPLFENLDLKKSRIFCYLGGAGAVTLRYVAPTPDFK